MRDDFEMYERFDDEEDERVKLAKRRFRSGAEVNEGGNKALWNAVVIFLGLVVIVMLFFVVSLKGQYDKLKEGMQDLGFSQDGISQSGKVEELSATVQALTARLDALEGKAPQTAVNGVSTTPNASAKPQASVKPGTATTAQGSPAPNATTAPSTNANAPQAVAGVSKQYTVGDNETLWGIAEKLYKSGARSDEIAKLNGFDEKKAKALHKGQVILVPEK